MSHDALAMVVHNGRTFTLRVARARLEELLLEASAGPSGHPAWSARLPTSYHHTESASMRTVRGGLEIRVLGYHVKDDSRREFVFRYTEDGAQLVG